MDNTNLTWDDLADFYHKKTGGHARTKPMNDIFDWAEKQPEIVAGSDGGLKFKEEKRKLK